MSTPASDSFTVFIIGITGYIGGAAAIALKKKYPSYRYIAFTRSKDNAATVEKLGFEAIVGTKKADEDHKLIAKYASIAHVVINTADADDLELTNTILDALTSEDREIKLPIYIHTSGTGVLADKPNGEFQETAKKVWDDNKPEDIKAIKPGQPHRKIDLAIFEAAKGKKFISYIIAPSTIYGVALDNPVHQISQQIPNLIQIALKGRKAIYAGPGTNRWNNVHIYDLAQLYVLLFDKAVAERKSERVSSDPFERFYWGSVGSHVWGDVVRGLAPILFEKGLVDSPEASSANAKDFPWAVACNSISVSNRGSHDGWKPSHPSLEDTLREDIDGLLESQKK